MNTIKIQTRKELYYSICCFLMENRMTNGMIYSNSKEILDGISEYMSAVKIPWCYKKSEYKGIGYCLTEERLDIDDNTIKICSKNNNMIELYSSKEIIKYEIDSLYSSIDLKCNSSMDFTTVPMHLKNEQIREMFLKAFVIAEEEIDIISPWMNFGVVNERFIELVRNALVKGVVIKIKYGLKPDTSDFNILRSNRSDQVAEYLRETFREFSNKLLINRDNIHYKLVLCDDKFKLEGGYNYLSFVGDYSNEDTRKEGSPFGTDKEEIKYLRKEYFE